jgi:hypothetical protein
MVTVWEPVGGSGAVDAAGRGVIGQAAVRQALPAADGFDQEVAGREPLQGHQDTTGA